MVLVIDRLLFLYRYGPVTGNRLPRPLFQVFLVEFSNNGRFAQKCSGGFWGGGSFIFFGIWEILDFFWVFEFFFEIIFEKTYLILANKSTY